MARTRKTRKPARDIKAVYQEITDEVIALLERGVAPWAKPWATGPMEAGAQRNGTSGRRYSGINVLLTMMQMRSTPRWYTFKQAKGLGGSVRKGEKSTRILFYKTITREEENDRGEMEERSFGVPRVFRVFNADQIEWPEGSEHAPASESQAPILTELGDLSAFADAQRLFDASGAVLTHGGGRAFYDPNTHSITMPEPTSFESAEAYFAVLLHELTHWTARHVDREVKFTAFGTPAYAREELVAELGAAFMGAHVGIRGRLEHASYIQSWLKVLREDNRAIFRAAREAQIAADWCLERANISAEPQVIEAA